jgi:hypothetical protein
VAGLWFSPGPLVFPGSSTDKTDYHDITEILLKVALTTITQANTFNHLYLLTSNTFYHLFQFHLKQKNYFTKEETTTVQQHVSDNMMSHMHDGINLLIGGV